MLFRSLECLLDAKANVNDDARAKLALLLVRTRTRDFETGMFPVPIPVGNGPIDNTDRVMGLLEGGKRRIMNARNDEKNTTLMEFSRHAVGTPLRNIIASCNTSDVNEKNSLGESAIFFAVRSGEIDNVKCLLEINAQVHIVNDIGMTPFILAAGLNHVKMLQLLLDHSVDISSRGPQGCTALMWAARKGQTDACRFLIDMKSDVNVTNNFGDTALIEATGQEDNHSVVEALVEARAEVNVMNETKLSPLMLAAELGVAKTIRCLIDAKADIERKGCDGCTALLWAIRHARHASIKCLIKYGKASLHVLDSNGNNALINAASCDVSIVKFLVDSKVSLHAKNNDGFTLADIVSKAEKPYKDSNTYTFETCADRARRITIQYIQTRSRVERVACLDIPVLRMLHEQIFRALGTVWFAGEEVEKENNSLLLSRYHLNETSVDYYCSSDYLKKLDKMKGLAMLGLY